MDGNDEFDEQLRMQELYGDAKDADTQKEPDGQPDSFGQQPADTPYEWDLDKKAWFPKVGAWRGRHCRAGPPGQPSRGVPFPFSLLRSRVSAPAPPPPPRVATFLFVVSVAEPVCRET